MDFSRAGYVHNLPGAFRARAQWKDGGRPRECYGPRRPDEEAAKDDLESMRAAASGMSREEGFAAMKVEADALKAGKAPKKVGSIERAGKVFRAHLHFREEGTDRDIHGPWRPDEETAKADLESMRAAASGMGREDGFAAMAAEAKRLIAGKAPKAEGSVEPMGVVFRARIQWRVEGSIIPARGPRRAEKRRA